MRNGLEKTAILLGLAGVLLAWCSAGVPMGLESSTEPVVEFVRAGWTTSDEGDVEPAGTPRDESGTDLAQPSADARRDGAKGDSLHATEANTTPDDDPHADLRTRLDRSIAHAAADRGFTITPGLVDAVVERGAVRILFPIASADQDAARATVDALRPGTRLPGDLRFFPLLGQGAARVDGEQLLALIDSGLLPSIERDEIHRPSLATTVSLIRADEAHVAGDDGTGRAIAILDTGLDTGHPFFAGRVVEEACFSLLGTCPNAATVMTGAGAASPCTLGGCSHGTSVAGIAGARAPDDSLVGVAPGADLIAIQVFSDLGTGDIGAYTSDIVAGLQHVLALSVSYEIDVVNLSLGGDTHSTVASCEASSGSTVSAVATLRSAGILTVAAGGNDGLVDAITRPSCLSNVIGVGAATDLDLVPGYSNSTSLLTLLAPGVSIESALNGGGTSFVGGTSMAAPHVSGAVALIRSRHPAATPAEIENALVLGGVPVYDPRGDVTLPRLDVQAAIDLLSAAAAAVGTGGGGPTASASASESGGGGACGLVGLEPFFVVGVIRLARRRRR